jgi:signal transduction histidine kinase
LAKKENMELARLRINEVITDTIPLVERQALTHRVRLRLDLEPELPIVHGDRVQLQQVIINLIVNGIDAMAPVGDRPRELHIRSVRYGDDQVSVVVEDCGIGFPPDKADSLFNAFYTTKPHGMGMGLSICRAIIEAHGGKVWASPNSGPGATVQFTLPPR